MAAFKDNLDRTACERLAQAYSFDQDFVTACVDALPALELKGRVAHIADTLRAHLDPSWPVALEQLLAGLPPGMQTTEYLDHGFDWWPVVDVVGRHGLEHPEVSVAALAELTQRFSGEMAIRPFLREHPEVTWGYVRRWVTDTNPHVRRLASEGTRPRLPWGGFLRHEPAWDVLDALVEDDTLYVRRSVANHLGDIAKDHPEQAVERAAGWKETEHGGWVIRHGLRHLVKKGHLGALALQGFTEPSLTAVNFTVEPQTVRFPGEVTFSLEGTLGAAQDLVVDAVVHFVTAKGSSPKTWKWSTKGHKAGALNMSRRYRLKPISTRRFHAGRHRVELQVNGRILAESFFDLEMP
jgi:3-methyladenine DNA glycosylase AlkC